MILDLVRRHRAWLDRWLLWGGVGLSVVAAAAGLLLRDPWARFFVSVYTAPLLLAGPLWLRLRLREMDRVPERTVLLDLAVFALAAVRSVVGEPLPFSGHMLFLVYAVAVTPQWAYRLFAAVLLAGTTVYKLRLRDDPASWAWGVGCGLAAALLYALFRRSARSGQSSAASHSGG